MIHGVRLRAHIRPSGFLSVALSASSCRDFADFLRLEERASAKHMLQQRISPTADAPAADAVAVAATLVATKAAEAAPFEPAGHSAKNVKFYSTVLKRQ